jgi:hypothetical protein
VLVKVAEYLNVGVVAVGVLDPERATLHLFEPDRPVQILLGNDELSLPAILGDFRVTIRSFLD